MHAIIIAILVFVSVLVLFPQQVFSQVNSEMDVTEGSFATFYSDWIFKWSDEGGFYTEVREDGKEWRKLRGAGQYK